MPRHDLPALLLLLLDPMVIRLAQSLYLLVPMLLLWPRARAPVPPLGRFVLAFPGVMLIVAIALSTLPDTGSHVLLLRLPEGTRWLPIPWALGYLAVLIAELTVPVALLGALLALATRSAGESDG